MAKRDTGTVPFRELIGDSAGLAAESLRVALVDDEEGVHQLVSGVFQKYARQWTLDSFLDPVRALTQIPRYPPQAVIMDIKMAGMTGIECAKKLKQLLPNLPIVMLSAYLDEEMLTHCLMAGACGCLFKPASAMEIVGAIKKAVAGSLAFCPQSEKTVLGYFARLGEKRDGWELTRRERDVLDGIRRQESDKEIAERLKIAPSTVHVHMASLFKKLKVHTRTEALMKILQ